MHFVLYTPSLQHLAQVKIVAHLWTQRHIFTQIAESFTGRPARYELREHEKTWVEEKITSKVRALPLPKPCQRELLHLVNLIGVELIDWCHYHNGENTNDRRFLNILLPQQLLCWTMHGTIDYGKTAELMVKDERLDVGKRYEIACVNCLEDRARELFQSMGEERRKEYVNSAINVRSLLLSYFTCTFTGDSRSMDSLFRSRRSDVNNKVLFREALLNGDGTMGEYWFQKLSQQGKERVLKESPMHVRMCGKSRASSLLYYVSLMNEEQQLSMFRKPSNVLIGLLRWPMLPLFVAVAKRGWQLMDSHDCTAVLYAIIDKICREGSKDYDYSPLFWECWRLSSADYKLCFLHNSSTLPRLLRTERDEFVTLILNEASYVEIKVFHDIIWKMVLFKSIISDAALMECRETAARNSANAPEDEEKRRRSQKLNRFVGKVLKSRKKNGKKVHEFD